MKVIITWNFYKHQREQQTEIFEDIDEIEFENQNEYDNGTWLILRGSGIKVNDGELYVDWDQRSDYFEIRK